MFYPNIIWRSSSREIKKELIQWYNSLERERFIPGFFSYYSVWNAMMMLISNRIVIPDIVSYVPWLMALQCFIAGFYITHIYPRRIIIYYLNMHIDYGLLLIIMDVLAHQLPLLYVQRPEQKLDLIHWIPGLFPFLVYWKQFSIFDKYDLDTYDILICFFMYTIICILFS